MAEDRGIEPLQLALGRFRSVCDTITPVFQSQVLSLTYRIPIPSGLGHLLAPVQVLNPRLQGAGAFYGIHFVSPKLANRLPRRLVNMAVPNGYDPSTPA